MVNEETARKERELNSETRMETNKQKEKGKKEPLTSIIKSYLALASICGVVVICGHSLYQIKKRDIFEKQAYIVADMLGDYDGVPSEKEKGSIAKKIGTIYDGAYNRSELKKYLEMHPEEARKAGYNPSR